jgi:hypothetical protein
MDLRAHKGGRLGRKSRCKGRTKVGKKCTAPAVEGGFCYFHAHPDKLSELGRQGGKKNRHGSDADEELQPKALRATGDVVTLLEETINRVRQGPFDLRAANSIGFLAGVLLKALDECRIEERLSNLEAAVTGNTDANESFQFKTMKESQNE